MRATSTVRTVRCRPPAQCAACPDTPRPPRGALASACSTASMTRRASCRKARPAQVRLAPRGVRWNRSLLSRPPACGSCRIRGDCSICRRFAARPKCNSSATAMKAGCDAGPCSLRHEAAACSSKDNMNALLNGLTVPPCISRFRFQGRLIPGRSTSKPLKAAVVQDGAAQRLTSAIIPVKWASTSSRLRAFNASMRDESDAPTASTDCRRSSSSDCRSPRRGHAATLAEPGVLAGHLCGLLGQPPSPQCSAGIVDGFRNRQVDFLALALQFSPRHVYLLERLCMVSPAIGPSGGMLALTPTMRSLRRASGPCKCQPWDQESDRPCPIGRQSARFSDSCMIRSVSLSARTRSRHCTSSCLVPRAQLRTAAPHHQGRKTCAGEGSPWPPCACTASNCRRGCVRLRSVEIQATHRRGARRLLTRSIQRSRSCSLTGSRAWIVASQSIHKSANAQRRFHAAPTRHAIRSVASS